jgi:serpin B
MINQWAATHTMGVINKVFNHPLPPTTAAVFTNAIYFKGDWETPFNSRFTIEGTFRSNDTHTVDVQFMRGQFDLMYVDSERLGCRMIAIPYRHAKAAMYVILPERGDLYKIRRFAAGLSVDDIRELISSTRLSSVTLLMPKMKLSHTLSFRNVLSQFQEQNEPEFQKLHAPGPHYKKTQESEIGAQPLGCHGWNCSQYGQAPCNLSAQFAKPTMAPEKEDRFYFDMSGASPDQRFRVDDVVENIFLEVSEVGTIGAAVGTTTVDYIGEFRNFKLDRPFLFFIRHEITGTLFFWGAIVDPTNDEGT